MDVLNGKDPLMYFCPSCTCKTCHDGRALRANQWESHMQIIEADLLQGELWFLNHGKLIKIRNIKELHHDEQKREEKSPS